MKKLTILCDLDGIIVDLLKAWLDFHNAKYGDNFTKADITEFAMHKCVKPEHRGKIYEFLNLDNCFDDLQPIPGAIEAVNNLIEKGHDFVVLTASAKNPMSAFGKIKWVKKYLGLERQQIIVSSRKELICGDVLIDDSPDNIKAYNKRWPNTPILSIAYPYNAEVSDRCLCFNDYNNTEKAWAGIVAMIDNMAHYPEFQNFRNANDRFR